MAGRRAAIDTARPMRCLTSLSIALFLAACSHSAPCPAGTAPAAFAAPPLSSVLLPGAHVCTGPPDAMTVTLWVDRTVHEANMASVDLAQSSGWSRTSDNWYASTDFSDSPKWSELSGTPGTLRIDVRPVDSGGATVVYTLTPRAAAMAPPVPAAAPVAAPTAAPGTPPADALRVGTGPVVMQMFLDFEGPFDSRFAGTLNEVLRERGDTITLVVRHRPLPMHPHAHEAAEAVAAVRAQLGDAAAWRYGQLLFANRTSLDRPGLLALGAQIEGLDAARLAADLTAHTFAAVVDADGADAERLGILGTPAGFVGATPIRGAQPASVLLAAIDAAR